MLCKAITMATEGYRLSQLGNQMIRVLIGGLMVMVVF